jgi:hypothetical protein
MVWMYMRADINNRHSLYAHADAVSKTHYLRVQVRIANFSRIRIVLPFIYNVYFFYVYYS